MNYLARTIAPDLMEKACELFDNQIKQTALSFLKLTPDVLSQVANELLHLPLRLGGFGLCLTLPVSPAAYLGSLAAAAPLLAKVPHPQLHTSPHLQHLKHAFHRLGLPSSSLPLPSPELFINNFIDQDSTPKLQKRISAHYYSSKFVDLQRAADPTIQAHLLSISQRSSSTWLSTIPVRQGYLLADRDFLLASRLRLRLHI